MRLPTPTPFQDKCLHAGGKDGLSGVAPTMIERGIHDVGGLDEGPIDRSEHDRAFWEQRVDALMVLLTNPKRAGGRLMTVDELRRGIESLGREAYDTLGYYERWITSITANMLEKNIVTVDELGAKLAAIETRERNR